MTRKSSWVLLMLFQVYYSTATSVAAIFELHSPPEFGVSSKAVPTIEPQGIAQQPGEGDAIPWVEEKSKRPNIGGRLLTFIGFGQNEPFLQSFEDNVKNYVTALQCISSTSKNEALFEGKRYLKSANYVINLGHFTAFAHLCNVSNDIQLISDVVRSLIHCNVSDRCNKLFEMKPPRGASVININNVPHRVLYTFFMRNISSWAEPDQNGNHSIATLNGMILLSRSGLNRKQENVNDWESLRNFISPKLFLIHVDELVRVLGEDEAMTLYLQFQRNFSDFLEAFKHRHKFSKTRLSLTARLMSRFQYLAEMELKGDVFRALLMWKTVIDSKSTIQFSDISLFGTFVKTIGLGTIESIIAMSQLVEITNHNGYLRLVRQTLRENFERNTFSMDTLVCLLNLPLGSFVGHPEVLNAFLAFVSVKMKYVQSQTLRVISQKLQLLDLAYKKCGCEKWLVNDKTAEGFLKRCFNMIVSAAKEKNHCLALFDCLMAAAAEENMFFLPAVDNSVVGTLEDIANDAIRGCFQKVASDPVLLHNIPSPEGETPIFFSIVVKRLVWFLQRQLNAIEDATQFYRKVVDPSSLSSISPAVQISQELLLSSLQKWKLQSFVDISSKYKPTIDVLFSKDFSDYLDLKNYETLHVYRNSIEKLARIWISSFQKDEVTSDDLLHVKKSMEALTWDCFERFSGVNLPSVTVLEAKYVEMDRTIYKIKELLVVDVEGRGMLVSRILNEYRCVPGIELNVIFQSYQNDIAALRSIKTNAVLVDDHKRILDLHLEYKETFYLCGYFLGRQSLLFRDLVLQRNEAHSIETLRTSVDKACKQIADTFGPDMHYEGVAKAMTVLETSEMLHTEIHTLLACSKLQLSASYIEHFHLIKFLMDIKHPLQQFIKCLEMFEFAIPNNDTSFTQMKSNISSFYETSTSKQVHVCLHFFDSVAQSFCFKNSVTTRSTKRAIPYETQMNDFKKVMPWVNLLGLISTHPELWYYLGEMEWFGDDGLKRFYEEYDNVTNVLLGQAASYEMSLLVSVEPVVRVISIMGKCKHIKTIYELYRYYEANCDLKAAVQDVTLENHIMQVHAKLSEIKEWFTSGIDEVAASHSMFTKAINSGMFLIINENSKNYFALVASEITLYGDSLEQFILQLSLIQNESKSTAGAMQTFIEQFHLLKAAARNFITMDNVGFPEVSVSSLVCRAGADHIDAAKNLNQLSHESLQDFKRWLSSVRRKHKFSMLYWTEELRDIYENFLTKTSIHNMDFTFRLRQLWKNDYEIEEDNALLRQALSKSIKRNMGQNVSWLEEVSQVIEDLDRRISASCEKKSIHEKSEIILHSLRCADPHVPLSTFTVLQQIYKGRLPYSFEILDGAIPCDEGRFSLFLERVKAFSSLKFTIVGADKLESKNLELLLSFLTNREVESYGICFHCVQNGDSLIHTAPWIEGKSWDAESLSSIASDWNTKIPVYGSVKVVSNPHCGSGKTLYIKQQLEAFCRESSKRRAASVILHEMTTLSTLVQELRFKFKDCDGNLALHLSLNFMPSTLKNEQWLAEMNHFFFSLIALRFVYDTNTATSFSITEDFELFIEMPGGAKSCHSWLNDNIPILAFCANFQDVRMPYIIDDKARRVCTYLRAYENGTINRKYNSVCNKRIVLVLDISGSMNGAPFTAAVDNSIAIFDTHIVSGDEFGVTLFDHNVHNVIPIQLVDDNKAPLRDKIRNVPYYGGGTSMYAALGSVLRTLSRTGNAIKTWIVCLTDGVSDGKEYDAFRSQVVRSPENQHLVTIGINLSAEYEQGLREICKKFSNVEGKGFFVRADGTIAGLNRAFDVVKSRIPVSQTFERDGCISDDECRRYMSQYMPNFVHTDDMITKSFWVRFLYRRVQVFDHNESFNYNEEYDNLGSSLMEIMLLEVDRLISNNHQREWEEKNHVQLIYDFTIPQSPEFRLVCTAPDQLEPELRAKLSSFRLPGFRIPAKSELDNRVSLDLFLSAAIGVPLQKQKDGLLKIQCIDDNGFVLTIDFSMKLLNIHERVACRIPCIIEGETGVSKTALTKMYSILCNHAMNIKAQSKTLRDLKKIETQLLEDGYTLPSAPTEFQRLDKGLKCDSTGELTKRMMELLREKAAMRPAIFVDIPTCHEVQDCVAVRSYLKDFSNGTLEKTFYEINVDASLTEDDFVGFFEEINAAATKLFGSEATIVVFLDEINTSTILGLLKEIIIDHSFRGVSLMENIVVVAACNPPRNQIQTTTRERDLGKTWVSGHYQVSQLPPSLQKMKWCFGALSTYQEKEFIFRRMQLLHGKTMNFLAASLTEIICTSHEMIRQFATENICENLMRLSATHDEYSPLADVNTEANERAKSAVSLRDIQRVFTLYSFLLSDMKDILYQEEMERSAMLLSVVIVYYFRLDGSSREKFIKVINSLPTESNQNFSLLDVLNTSMDRVLKETKIPVGIAKTRGLMENLFSTVVCSLSQTPLIIVGPPGASKTLAVNIVGDNAHGSDSHSEFYRTRPRLSLFHYQCSKKSTSKEIAAVFNQAVTRQEKVDSTKNRCVVFMDEAGLPEEEKESLKVLHYLLEGHMSAKAKVGFVAISNHILDAAKSNRCVMLLRQDLDVAEMLAIASGVLFDFRQDCVAATHDVEIDGAFVPVRYFAECFCFSYSSLFDGSSPVSSLNTFFGLRDFIYLLKSIRSMSSVESTRLILSTKDIVYAIERNFNGVSRQELCTVISMFLKPLSKFVNIRSDILERSLRDPVTVLKDALKTSSWENQLTRPRFKLIIDCTDDDSILRLLRMSGIVNSSRKSLHKLSNLPDDVEFERIRLVSSVKYAAMQGSFTILSQTESVNESFYDLFNQRFHELTKQDGTRTMFANIAVGGISRRCLVLPTFECVIHLRESNLTEIPAPFLNRFEKYRLTLHDVFETSWSRVHYFTEIIKRSADRTSQILDTFRGQSGALCWINNMQTVESVFVDMLPAPGEHCRAIEKPDSVTFDGNIASILEMNTSLQLSEVSDHVDVCIQLALNFFPDDVVLSLKSLINGKHSCDTLLEAFRSESKTSTVAATKSKIDIVSSILQMVLTRIAIFRVTQLCTPETIFINRNNIPTELIQEYFDGCHFSLKQHLSNRPNNSALYIVHTRSDQIIHMIPSLPADRTVDNAQALYIAKKLIHDNPEEVVIEHLNRLRSESMIRASIDAWLAHETRKVYIVLVDMNHSGSFDQVNFIRMQVEQNLTENKTSGKSFTLLLHYPPSSSLCARCYPALFLGGWEHIFLDSVGDGSVAQFDRFISHACFSDDSGTRGRDDCEQFLIKVILPRVLPQLASLSLFYRDQTFLRSGSFGDRKVALRSLLAFKIDSFSIEQILCENFAGMWFDNILTKVTHRCSISIVNGTTQLSLATLIQRAMVHIFQAYACDILLVANQWRNLDLLSYRSPCEVKQNPIILKLFEMVLRQLPSGPVEELLLQRRRYDNNQLTSIPINASNQGIVRFPFFYLISNYLDELAESVVEKISSKNGLNVNGASSRRISDGEILQEMMNDLDAHSEEKFSTGKSERGKLTRTVVDFVIKTSPKQKDCELSLFRCYLQQYIEWKIGCVSHSLFLNWWVIRLQQLHEFAEFNIAAIHAIAKLNKLDIIHMASAISLTESLDQNLKSDQEEELIKCQDPCMLFLQSCRNEDPQLYKLWPLLLSSAFYRSNGEQQTHGVEFINTLTKLRQIGIYYRPNTSKEALLEGLGRVGLISSQQSNAVMHVAENDGGQPETIVSLRICANNLGEREQGHTMLFLLQRFLSPEWLRVTHNFLSDDVEVLIDSIEKGTITGSTAAGLLKSAMISSKTCQDSLFYGCSLKILLQINERISTGIATQFAEDGTVISLPYYIPEWLKVNPGAVTNSRISSVDSPKKKFFPDYQSGIDGELANVVFEICCGLFLSEASSLSSSDLFLVFLREFDSELQQNRQKFTHLARLRNTGAATSIRGTQVSMIALSARIVCLIAKIATEIAFDATASVLSGAYADEATIFLEELMSNADVAHWKDFFMSTILRLCGEGTLSSALLGPLRNMKWCNEWVSGIPSSSAAIVERLRLAEGALVDANESEQWKANNFRLCPNSHCREPFEVLALNCGRFVCGRNFHGDTRVRIQGCGLEFNIANALTYQIDGGRIAAAQNLVSEQQAQLNRFNYGSSLWERARSMKIPQLVVLDHGQKQLLPYASLLLEDSTDFPHARTLECLRILREFSPFSQLVEILPDMIEFYMWLHLTFRHFVTKEFAIATKISDILTAEILGARFDSARVHHILDLWDRVKFGFNTFLKDHRQQVQYECELVSVPFQRVEDTSLFSLLSEGAYPTQNDFLFLVINDAVLKYNTFVDKLSSVCTVSNVGQGRALRKNRSRRTRTNPPPLPQSQNPQQDQEMLSPKFIIRGFGATLKIGTVVPVSLDRLNLVAACSWDSNTKRFDWNTVYMFLSEIISLHERPLRIMNPLDHLRERFCFRNDAVPSSGPHETCSIVDMDRYGNFHANNHDYELVEGVNQILTLLNMVNGNDGARRVIQQLFQDFDYQRTLELLQGCEKILDEMLLSNTEPFDRLESLLDMNDESKSLMLQLQEYGFPEMDDKQYRFIIALNSEQFVELIRYCGYQLASEAHLFLNLPLHVGDPLPDDTRVQLKEKIGDLAKEHSPQTVVVFIETFVRDVLGFYEIQIVGEATKSNNSFRTYLVSQNFCDNTDPIFAVLPESISIRNYVSLRQSLQQIKLSFIFLYYKEEKRDIEQIENSPTAVESQLGRCWLWDCKDSIRQSETENPVQAETSSELWKLWFEKVRESTSENDDMEICEDYELVDSEVNETNNVDADNVTDHAAKKLQRWWRRKYEQIKDTDDLLCEYYGRSDESDQSCPGNNDVEMLESESYDLVNCTTDSQSNMVPGPEAETAPVDIPFTYGAGDDEMKLRRWLDDNALPQSVGDTLLSLGIRNMNDLSFILSEVGDDELEEILSKFATLDEIKLRKALKLLAASIESSNWLNETD